MSLTAHRQNHCLFILYAKAAAHRKLSSDPLPRILKRAVMKDAE